MSIRNQQIGFSSLELVIVIALVAVLGLVGYSVYNRQHQKTADATLTNQSSTATDVPTAPTINSTSDLDKATATLNATNPDTSNADAAQLDTELAAF